ncbi:MAG TPA: hypothetical protein PKG54_18565 [Phycisphaerae bacterium]|nr:hypothetical protein [Phycisphaerae bacterium]HOB76517.1 hypothetical protein [Phycisphaerae bacterium]HOJ56071.1 hypothetical protein [Phycisphaerae bacterium]HOL28299.1 hypothetical protein [Phycisphaerae bacterium]HPP22773.1 hypothetical protein [Phycisphaerae bacterium]
MFIVFLTTLAAGLLGALALCRLTQVAWRSVRLIAILALCLQLPIVAGFIAWAGWQRGPWPVWAAALTASAAMGAFVVFGLAPTARRSGSTIRLFAGVSGALSLAAAWAWGFDYRIWPDAPPLAIKASLAGQALSALLVGSIGLAGVLVSSLLAHSTMSLQPLKRLVRIFLAATGLRLLWLLLEVGGMLWYDPSGNGTVAAVLRSWWLLLGVLGGAGLLIPAGLAYMTLQTLHLRTVPPAARLVYLALVLAFIGELAALYVMRESGLPL